jgi:tripartite-type tricarboxylate transporter receptor subunit TctC
MNAKRKLMVLGIAGGCAVLLMNTAMADPVADFYKGKKVDLYIGYSAGGGYDTYARLLGSHIGKHIPGNPDVVPRNQPGAGSLTLANALYNQLPKDGTAFGIIGRGMVMEPLFGNKLAKFDPTKFSWIGSANNEVSVCVVWHTVPIKSIQDFLNTPLTVGGTGPGADTDVFPKVLNNVLGAHLKLITGYPGGNDISLAMERGEVQGRCGWSWSSVKSTRAQWLEQKKIQVVLQISTDKHPDLPNVPLVMDLAKSDKDKKILELIFARQAMGRPFVAPPGIPDARAKALQTAFMATMKDPKFKADAKKIDLEVEPISGDRIEKIVKSMYSAPKDIVEAAKQAIEREDKTSIEKVSAENKKK